MWLFILHIKSKLALSETWEIFFLVSQNGPILFTKWCIMPYLKLILHIKLGNVFQAFKEYLILKRRTTQIDIYFFLKKLHDCLVAWPSDQYLEMKKWKRKSFSGNLNVSLLVAPLSLFTYILLYEPHILFRIWHRNNKILLSLLICDSSSISYIVIKSVDL